MVTAVLCLVSNAQQTDELVSLNFSQTDISVVIEVMRGLRPNNTVVLDQNVAGSVNVDIKELPWETALRLIVEPNGFKLDKEGDTIFRISKAEEQIETAQKNESDSLIADGGITFSIYTNDELANLPIKIVKKLVGKPQIGDIAEKSEAEYRAELANNDGPYIKELLATKASSSEVMMQLAQSAKLSYTLITEYENNEPNVPIADPEAPELAIPVFTERSVTLRVSNISLMQVLEIIAKRGGYTIREEYGMYTFAPAHGVELEPLSTQIYKVQFIKVNEELTSPLKSLLTSRGTIQVMGNNILLINDVQENINQVLTAIAAVDVPIPQVQIEVRFFEITRNDDKQVGVDWSHEFFGKANFGAGNIISETTAVADPAKSALTFTLNNFDAKLEAFQNESYVTALANPKIIIASDEQARVHIGDAIPFVTAESETDDSGNKTYTYELNSDMSGDEKEALSLLEGVAEMPKVPAITGYLDTGTILTVAPSVKNEEDLYIKIVPELLGYAFDDKFKYNLGDDEFIQFPVISRTTVYTEFMIKSGQTAAIGGLVKDDLNTLDNGIPYLKDIPYLGWIFSYQSKTLVRKEVVIFVTAKIMKSGELSETSGVPVKAVEFQGLVNEIRKSDALGAEYVDQPVKMIDAGPIGLDDAIKNVTAPFNKVIENTGDTISDTIGEF